MSDESLWDGLPLPLKVGGVFMIICLIALLVIALTIWIRVVIHWHD